MKSIKGSVERQIEKLMLHWSADVSCQASRDLRKADDFSRRLSS